MKRIMTLLALSIFCIGTFTQCASIRNNRLVEKNKETVRLWFEEGWNHDRNIELLGRCFDPAWQDGNPLRADQVSGYDGMIELIKSYKKGASNTQFTITHLFADENEVAIRYEVTATHTGPLFGIEATGKEFSSTGIVLYDMKDGRILTSWQELDLSGIANQLRE